MRFLVFELWSILYISVENSVLDLAKRPGRFIAKYAVDANLFRLGSSILKHAGSKGAAPVTGVVGGAHYKKIKFLQVLTECIANQMKKKSIFLFRKCSNLHERFGMLWNERKIKFPIFPILIFRVMVISVFKIWSIFDEFSR